MEFTDYIRKPFVVKAIEVTEDNIEVLSEKIGKLCRKDDGTLYIQVNRKLVPNVYRVYLGFWVTEMNGNVHCYANKVFKAQFTEATPEVMQWVDYLNAGTEFPMDTEDDRNTSVIG